jgi:N-acetylmuramoyl-L-alanine amidase
MMKKIISILLLGVFLWSNCFMASVKDVQVEAKETIIETIRVKPNAEILAEGLVTYTQHWDEDVSDNTIQLSQQDAFLLMRIASAEALNQGVEGMYKVMEVVLNRVESDAFPDTIWGVYSQTYVDKDGVVHYQFESYANGSYKTTLITGEVHLALAEIEKNKNFDKTLVAFENKNNGAILTQWFEVAYTYKDHTFYTLKKD